MRTSPLLFLLTFFFIFFIQKSKAQEQFILVDTLEFANFEADSFVFDLDTSFLLYFYQKFDSMLDSKQGNINILHIGGSHVQAGVMSNQIREHFGNIYPNFIASRGLVFPYSIIPKSNNPIDYTVRYEGAFEGIRNVYKELVKPLGVSGVAVFSTDTFAEITIQLKSSKYYVQTDSVIIIGKSDSGFVTPIISIDSIEYYPSKIDTVLHLFFYKIPPFDNSFTIRWETDSGNHFTLTGIWLGNAKPGITFHSVGVNGASVPSYLNCENFERDLDIINPDMVIFGIGINDAFDDKFDTLDFEQNYLELIEKFQRFNPHCAFVFLTNNDSYKRVKRGKYAVNKNGELARKVFYRLAARTGGAVWDQFEIMGGLRSMYKWETHGLAKKDKIHFNNAGYKLIGDLFFNAWLDAKWKVEEKDFYFYENIE